MRYLKDLKKFSKKALVIVAHPDDESLFMGGTIAEFKRWRWTILCVTDCDERYNKRRRRELLKACRIYNRGSSHVKPVMLNVVKRRGRFSRLEAAQRLGNFINEFGPFDIIFTHNDKGDYGHKTHKLIYEIVKELRLPNVYNFYIAPYKESVAIATDMKTLTYQAIKLSPKSHRTKRDAINVYLKGSQKTNLSRLKRFVKRASNTSTELFNRSN